MTTTELTATEIANRLRPYIAAKTIDDIKFSFQADHIWLQNGYWHVFIHPSSEPESLFQFYEALADMEIEFQDKEGIKVTLHFGDPLTGYIFNSSPCCDETEAKSVPLSEPTELTPANVANLVRPYVTKTTVNGITLWLDEAHIAYRNGYWQLPIRPSVEPEPMYPYFEALTKLDMELRDKEGLRVSIVSGNPLAIKSEI